MLGAPSDLVCTLNHLRLDPMEVLSKLHEPLVVLPVLWVGAYQLRQTRHDGSDGLPGVLVGLLGVQRVVLQGAVFLLQTLVCTILEYKSKYGGEIAKSPSDSNLLHGI